MEHLKNLSHERISFKNTLDKVTLMLGGLILGHDIRVLFDFQVAEIIYPQIYLDSIIMNLLSNAIKYRFDHRQSQVICKTYMRNNHVILEVSDNGVGIDLTKNGDKIFQINQTFHDHPDAKGLGLYLIKNHIESLGGNIQIESEVGAGTTFIVDFGQSIILDHDTSVSINSATSAFAV
ncbi:MAG: hypothetical protein NVSMB46_09740 [Candidatus Saccharimonadales bacterium]